MVFPKISIISPTRNRKNKLIRCLKSIESLDYPKDKLEVIIVDNASNDGTTSVVKKEFPKVKIIENEYNLGVSTALNIGIKESSGNFIFIFEDDLVLEKGCLKKLVTFSLENPKIIAAGGLFYYNKKNRIRNLGGKINFFTSKIKIRGKDEIYRNQYGHSEADVVGGATLLINRKIFEEIGYFDERFFWSYEDLDWCLRLKKKGYKIIVLPEAKIFHDHKISEKPSPFSEYHIIRSKIIFMKKYMSIITFWFFPLQIIYTPLILIYFLIKNQKNLIIPYIDGMLSGIFFPKKIFYTKNFKRLVRKD